MVKEGERRGREKSNEVLIRGVPCNIDTMLLTTHENIQLVWQYGGMEYGGMNSLGGRQFFPESIHDLLVT